MEQKTYSVRLLRCSRQGEWVELRKEAVAQVTSTGLVVRESVSSSLLADFPFASVQKLEKISPAMVTVNTLSDRMALLFSDVIDATQFYVNCAALKWPIQDSTLKLGQEEEFHLPQLNHPAVQDFVVKLIFSDEFKSFVSDLKGLLLVMKEEIAK